MTSNNSFSKSFILRSHRPGDMGYITYRHGEIYAKEHGYDARFESLVSRITAEFLDNLQPNLDRCWIAEKDGVFLGCIMLVHDKKPKTAKLRLFLVEESARGFGVGTGLIQECIKFAREAGYAYIDLWTESNLEGARRLYSRAGFNMVRTENYDDWGVELCFAKLWWVRLSTSPSHAQLFIAVSPPLDFKPKIGFQVPSRWMFAALNPSTTTWLTAQGRQNEARYALVKYDGPSKHPKFFEVASIPVSKLGDVEARVRSVLPEGKPQGRGGIQSPVCA
ncbi:hypothetical protein ACKRZS_005500 [Fusarium odoratissimum]